MHSLVEHPEEACSKIHTAEVKICIENPSNSHPKLSAGKTVVKNSMSNLMKQQKSLY